MPKIIKIPSYLDRPLSQMTIKDDVRLQRYYAAKSSERASVLVFNMGLKGEISDEFVRTVLEPEIFDVNGNLTKKGLETMRNKYITCCLIADMPFRKPEYTRIGDYQKAVIAAIEKRCNNRDLS